MQLVVYRMKGRRLLAAVISLVLVFILFAGVLLGAPAIVLAASAGGIKTTIASLVISLLLQSGVAPTNQTWLNSLNNAYGVTSSIGTIEDCISSGLLTQTANGLVDSGLSNAIASVPEYTSLGLEDLFGTTASDVGVTVASGASNICNTAINVGTLGTIGAFAGAATIGVGLGVLVNHVREKFIDYIRQGVEITYNADVINQAPAGTRAYINSYGAYQSTQYRVNYFFFPIQSVVCAYKSSDWSYNLVGASKNPGNYDYKSYFSPSQMLNKTGTSQIYSYPSVIGWHGGVGNWGTPKTNVPIFADEQACKDYVQQKMDDPNYTFTPHSPDLIGPYGNQIANENPNTGEIETPGIRPMVPEGSDMVPADMDDYQTYVDTANNNTDNDVTGEVQGDAFIDFVNPYIQQQLPETPDQPTDPETPDQPTDPETPTTNPWPVVDRPVTPDQPTVDPKPTITPEQQGEGLGLSTPDLRGIFPFCIPFDLYNLVRGLSASREAPSITVPVDLDGNTITVDLSPYNSAAQILRALELIAFVVGLAVATRKLIGS